MIKILASISLSSVFLFACNNTSDSSNTSETASDTSVMYQTPVSTNAPVQVQTQDSSLVASPVSAIAAPSQGAVPAAVGMNPAHGEPGHRCDIAVGAPLNSPPSTPAAAPAPGTVVTAPSTAVAPAPASPPSPAQAVTPAPVTTAPGTNPPHGQPGHDCKIAVGAPLPK